MRSELSAPPAPPPPPAAAPPRCRSRRRFGSGSPVGGRRRFAYPTRAGLVLALTACATASTTPSPTPSASLGSSPSPTPSASIYPALTPELWGVVDTSPEGDPGVLHPLTLLRDAQDGALYLELPFFSADGPTSACGAAGCVPRAEAASTRGVREMSRKPRVARCATRAPAHTSSGPRTTPRHPQTALTSSTRGSRTMRRRTSRRRARRTPTMASCALARGLGARCTPLAWC